SGGFTSGEDWQAGPALSAMLAKTLAESGRFVLVERSQLDDVLNEQTLAATGVAGGARPTVKMIPAQYLVVGAVTEFGSPNKGGGMSLGSGLGGGLVGGLAVKKQTGKISIDLRILNPRTGEVIHAFTVTREVSKTS